MGNDIEDKVTKVKVLITELQDRHEQLEVEILLLKGEVRYWREQYDSLRQRAEILMEGLQ